MTAIDDRPGEGATARPWRATTEGSYDQRHAAAKAFESVMATRAPDCPDCQFSDLTWITFGDDVARIALVGNGPKSTDNAALIVEAVNAYDRLRAIEAAARAVVNGKPDSHWPSNAYTGRDGRMICVPLIAPDGEHYTAWDALRAALEGTTR